MLSFLLIFCSCEFTTEVVSDENMGSNSYKISGTGELTIDDDILAGNTNLVLEGTGSEGITIIETSYLYRINLKLKGIIHISENAFTESVLIGNLYVCTSPDYYPDLSNIPDIIASIYFIIEDAKDDEMFKLQATFQNHASLNYVNLDHHISEIVDNAFRGCSNLNSIDLSHLTKI